MSFLSPYLLAVIAGWIIAQGAKYVIKVVKTGDIRQVRQLYLSGNMPSAHAASVIALLTVVGMIDGTASALFALALLFASIVMYDAVMVRRSSGEQGRAIQQLIKESKSVVTIPRAAKGHTPMEVLVGAVLGALIGVVVVLAT
jgi:acid phosphatase family membrane protein YuiD